jgi:hypothetical protein
MIHHFKKLLSARPRAKVLAQTVLTALVVFLTVFATDALAGKRSLSRRWNGRKMSHHARILKKGHARAHQGWKNSKKMAQLKHSVRNNRSIAAKAIQETNSIPAPAPVNANAVQAPSSSALIKQSKVASSVPAVPTVALPRIPAEGALPSGGAATGLMSPPAAGSAPGVTH